MTTPLLSDSSSQLSSESIRKKNVGRHIVLYDILGKGVLNIIDVVGLIIAVKDGTRFRDRSTSSLPHLSTFISYPPQTVTAVSKQEK